MRIAMLSNAAVVHTRRWVEQLRRRGHDVALWSLERGPASLAARRLPGVAAPGFIRYPLAVPALRRALAAYRPDVVVAHYVPNYGLMGVLAGVRPLVVVTWGSDLLVAARRDLLQRARARFVLARADAVLADSENLAAAARDLGAPAARVLALPWGVDLERFRPASARATGLLFTARMHEAVYDVPTILDGAAAVLARRPQAMLIVAGDGSLRPQLERHAARVLPAGRYRFVGTLDSATLAGWLARAEVYLSASRSDSTSVSLLEAMAAGALPVVTDIDGNREWVRDGESGRLFPPGDAAALSRALDAVLDDPAWAERARARNRAEVARRADWTANMATIEARLEELARAAAARERP